MRNNSKDLTKRALFLFLICLNLALMCCSSNEIVVPDEPPNYLTNKWLAQKAELVGLNGELISTEKYEPEEWLDAVVPGTVLATLLHNELIPNPFFSKNNELIPDIYNMGVEYYTYWFYTRFNLPPEIRDRRIWLNLRGINYEAEVYLNGKKVNKTTLEGMFKRFNLDITDFISFDGENILAIIVSPPNPPGNAARGQGGDGIIGKNVTMQFTAGWDWIKPVRDRNTGIWDKISINETGAVLINDPYITTEVPGIRQPEGDQAPAFIHVSTEVENVSDQTISGILKYSCIDKTQEVRVQLAPGESRDIQFDRKKIKNPRLWWPNGSGKQDLYEITLEFFDRNEVISDKKKVCIGIRKIGSYFDRESGGRVFTVNGQKLFIRGGNWIASDAYLRLSPDRYRAEVKMFAEMNLNMIRIWGGSISERPEFYKACDEFGLLVWQDFWITGDCNGAWRDRIKKDDQEGRRKYPDDHALFLESAEDTIKMLRNHPSLCLWSGGNEYPPPEDIDKRLRDDLIPKLDKDREYFSFSTSKELSVISTGRIVDGPYSIQEPDSFFTRRFPPFNSEIGSVGLPEYETMKQIMTDDELARFPRGRNVSDTWRYHCYSGYVAGDKDFIALYGNPESAEEFVNYAQLVNYDQYRSLLEGWNSHMWEWYTGLLIWKIQNPWTSLRGQLYDPFLDQNGGFFGARKAAEPVHIQLNLDDNMVTIVNNTSEDLTNLNVKAEMYDISGNKYFFREEKQIDLKTSSFKELFMLTVPDTFQGVYFVHLLLSDSHKDRISENFYWFDSENEGFSELHNLEEAELNFSLSTVEKGQGRTVEIILENKTKVVSFWNRLQVFNSETGERILPVYYSDNYFSIVPGGKKTVHIEFTNDNGTNTIPELRLTGWNYPGSNWILKNFK